MLVIGSRLGETTSQGFTLLDLPRPRQRLVHVHNDPEELGRFYQPDLAISAGLNAFAAAARALPPPRYRSWSAELVEAHAEELAWRAPTRIPGSLQLGEVVAWLRERLPPEAILTNGAGNYAIWANRHQKNNVPAIILGDLNATPWCVPFRHMIESANLTNAMDGRGFAGTFHAKWPGFLRIPIDHVLHTKELRVLRHVVGDDGLGSDHLPVQAWIEW